MSMPGKSCQLWCAAVVATLAMSLPIRAEDASRDDVLKEFKKVSDKNVQVWKELKPVTLQPDYRVAIPKSAITPRPKGGTFRPDDEEPIDKAKMLGDTQKPKFAPADPINTPQGPVTPKIMMKVWAELTEGADKGNFVHPEKYKWSPRERFYLWYEATAGVKVSLFQEFQTKKTELVMPHNDYPASFNDVPPGEQYRFPIEMWMDNNDEDEVMRIMVVLVGTDDAPTLTDEGGRKYSFKGAEKYVKKVREVNSDLKAKFSPVKDERKNVAPANVPDNVAIVAYSTDTKGYLQLTLRKQR